MKSYVGSFGPDLSNPTYTYAAYALKWLRWVIEQSIEDMEMKSDYISGRDWNPTLKFRESKYLHKIHILKARDTDSDLGRKTPSYATVLFGEKKIPSFCSSSRVSPTWPWVIGKKAANSFLTNASNEMKCNRVLGQRTTKLESRPHIKRFLSWGKDL